MKNKFTLKILILLCVVAWIPALGQSSGKRKIIIDQDAAGPAGTDQQSILLLMQSPQAEVLGITVVTGDAWLKDEVAHTLRMLELIGRTDIPVVAGAEYPLVRRKDETELWEKQYGSVPWVGAWTPRLYHPPDQLGEMPEGKPSTKPLDEDAAHFLVRMVRQYPHEITIYAGGPMTNIALAITIDPEFASLAKELIFMGGSLNPITDDPEFVNTPRHEFNLWFDPEAAHIVLTAPWKKVVCTTVDISVKTRLTQELIDRVKAHNTPAARYVGAYARVRGQYNYLWDELAAMAWLDPRLITAKSTRYLDVDLNHGASYGETLSWSEQDKPKIVGPPVEIQVDLDAQKFYKQFVDLLAAPTPKPQRLTETCPGESDLKGHSFQPSRKLKCVPDISFCRFRVEQGQRFSSREAAKECSPRRKPWVHVEMIQAATRRG
jgi:inosine-uridine nucleoside N-ribohydrolase